MKLRLNIATDQIRGFRAIAGMALILGALAASANAAVLVNTFNIYGVLNGPPKEATFTVPPNVTWNITQLEDYHWNSGHGTPTVGSFHIVDPLHGPVGTFAAFGVAGQGGVKNADWIANLNITLNPGTYDVYDDSMGTMSYNAQSGLMGFLMVQGTQSALPQVPYGGNCRGAGCTHPDLRPYGGDGPFGTVPVVSLHRPLPSTYKFLEFLSPSTTFAAQANVCRFQYGGNLVLTDDEPWYYYWIGYYARVVCE